MRLTGVLCVRENTHYRQFKTMWKSYKFKEQRLKLPLPLQEKNVEIIRGKDFLRGLDTKQVVVAAEPDPVPTPSLKKHPNYHEKPALTYTNEIQFIEGKKQACLLTKSREMEGVPAGILRLMDTLELPDVNSTIQKYIMNSQVWDPTNVKLTKRIDKEKIGYKFREFGIPRERAMLNLMTDLVRLFVSMMNLYPSARENRRLLTRPFLGSHYRYKGDLINIRARSEFLISSREFLPCFADTDAVKESVDYTIPDMHPVNPTIDLRMENLYSEQNIPAFRVPFEFDKPQTLFHLNKDLSKLVHRQNRALMFLLGYAMAAARRKYGDDVTDLPEPICVQCVNMNEATLNFTFFQLNTMDFSSDSGVKNFVWFDSGNHLFAKHLTKPWLKDPEFKINRYDSYSEEPLKKLLAVVMYGLSNL
ncbi:hypothetical protein FSP39_009180 [Pinctada imbricata]|uniref:39S ribosomal protein L37, mitochondrial n=1 Tax=Pinctada imbricata TaxID=66713 RepID=A0AA88YDL7_PINIB|nr:hypothetical protein FSP39_009180 [Pinctada imbricata]